uniref:Resistin-like beta n=1 Tax=Geotrypetes seraphini TaxID=260995 RepID=A0A6P8S914_GEOSA|nr:resistin-like beta [Geotrypetes seraphini]
MKVTGCFLLIVLLESGFVAADPEKCTISDLLTLESICKSKESTCNCKLACTDVVANGALATCPTGNIPTSCSCGMACGSWDIRNGTSCHCQCNNMDWTSARCCNLK